MTKGARKEQPRRGKRRGQGKCALRRNCVSRVYHILAERASREIGP